MNELVYRGAPLTGGTGIGTVPGEPSPIIACGLAAGPGEGRVEEGVGQHREELRDEAHLPRNDRVVLAGGHDTREAAREIVRRMMNGIG